MGNKNLIGRQGTENQVKNEKNTLHTIIIAFKKIKGFLER